MRKRIGQHCTARRCCASLCAPCAHGLVVSHSRGRRPTGRRRHHDRVPAGRDDAPAQWNVWPWHGANGGRWNAALSSSGSSSSVGRLRLVCNLWQLFRARPAAEQAGVRGTRTTRCWRPRCPVDARELHVHAPRAALVRDLGQRLRRRAADRGQRAFAIVVGLAVARRR